MEFADRLNNSLVQFLKRAYFHPDAPAFFYFVSRLNYPKYLLDLGCFENREADRYVLLHAATGFKSGDEMGLIFDQHTCKAAFVEHFEDMMPVVDNGYGWKPLEEIYNAYLEMIDEGKVEVSKPDASSKKLTWTRESNWDKIGPWLWHEFTDIDVRKSALAFKRLTDAIETRLPLQQPASTESVPQQETDSPPWGDSSVLDAAHIPVGTFARAFCEETARLGCNLSFQYIAPGIRIPTAEEFIAQPFYARHTQKPHYSMPVYLFCTEDPANPSNSATPESVTWLYHDEEAIPAGLYTKGHSRMSQLCQDSCHLILPFKFGSNGWARLSDLEVFGMKPWDDHPEPADVNADLYQPGYNGFIPLHSVRLHKVLTNWAERIESGDWIVTENGVAGGLEKWREADTEDGWQKYWIPLAW
jgi:hypothetical protein